MEDNLLPFLSEARLICVLLSSQFLRSKFETRKKLLGVDLFRLSCHDTDRNGDRGAGPHPVANEEIVNDADVCNHRLMNALHNQFFEKHKAHAEEFISRKTGADQQHSRLQGCTNRPSRLRLRPLPDSIHRSRKETLHIHSTVTNFKRGNQKTRTHDLCRPVSDLDHDHDPGLVPGPSPVLFPSPGPFHLASPFHLYPSFHDPSFPYLLVPFFPVP